MAFYQSVGFIVEVEKVLGDVEDLGGELSCGRDHYDAGSLFLGELLVVEHFDRWNQEGQRLARAGLCSSQYISSLQQVRDCACLGD